MFKVKLKTSLLLLCLYLFALNLYAQRLIDRNIIINPLLENNTNTALNVWGEFGLYRIKTDDDHSWLQKLGLIIDFYKTNNFSFSGISSIEFIADPHNDIRFNPRAIFWDEGFFITNKFENSFLQVGYYHRCKHDVDNLSWRKERTLIYGSISIKYIIPNLLSNEFENFLQSRFELYTLKYDHKTPKTLNKYSYDKLASSLGLNYNLTKRINENLSVIIKSSFYLNMFSDDKDLIKQFGNIFDVVPYFGLNGGLGFGEDNLITLLLNYEYLFDAGIQFEPSKSNLISLSLFLKSEIIE